MTLHSSRVRRIHVFIYYIYIYIYIARLRRIGYCLDLAGLGASIIRSWGADLSEIVASIWVRSVPQDAAPRDPRCRTAGLQGPGIRSIHWGGSPKIILGIPESSVSSRQSDYVQNRPQWMLFYPRTLKSRTPDPEVPHPGIWSPAVRDIGAPILLKSMLPNYWNLASKKIKSRHPKLLKSVCRWAFDSALIYVYIWLNI